MSCSRRPTKASRAGPAGFPSRALIPLSSSLSLALTGFSTWLGRTVSRGPPPAVSLSARVRLRSTSMNTSRQGTTTAAVTRLLGPRWRRARGRVCVADDPPRRFFCPSSGAAALAASTAGTRSLTASSALALSAFASGSLTSPRSLT